MPLSAERQHSIIRNVAKTRWNDLTRRLPLGRDAKTLLEGIGTFCHRQTFRETAPYMPGVTGIGITMQDRETLIDTPDDQIKHLRCLRDVLTSLVAHNLLVPRLDHSNWLEILNHRQDVLRYLPEVIAHSLLVAVAAEHEDALVLPKVRHHPPADLLRRVRMAAEIPDPAGLHELRDGDRLWV